MSDSAEVQRLLAADRALIAAQDRYIDALQRQVTALQRLVDVLDRDFERFVDGEAEAEAVRVH